MANVGVQAIVALLSYSYPVDPQPGSIAYDNNERELEGVVGRLIIDKQHMKLLKKDGIPDADVDALLRLLARFQPSGPPKLPPQKPATGKKTRGKRSKVSKPVAKPPTKTPRKKTRRRQPA